MIIRTIKFQPKHPVTLLDTDTPLIRRSDSLEVWVEHILVEVSLACVDVVEAPGKLVGPVPESLNLGSDDLDPVGRPLNSWNSRGAYKV